MVLTNNIINKNTLVSILSFVLSLKLVSADVQDGCGMLGYSGFGMAGGIFMWIISLLVITALILSIVWITKQIQKK